MRSGAKTCSAVAFLADPRGVVPRTRMAFPGLKDEADRADVIEYLATLKP